MTIAADTSLLQGDAPRAPLSPQERAAVWLYPATTFLSAALLFTLQPLFARMLTPLMGGAPAVWNTALVFYQGTLLLGYLYAHLVATRLAPRAQLWVHAGVLALGLIFLPLQVSKLVGAPDVANPVMWTLLALAASLGGPIIAVSATAPLVQAWQARLGDRIDPYRLYAASNLGSFSALAAYPFLIEPFVGAKLQAQIWSIGYVGLACALIGAVWLLPKASLAPREVATRPTRWRERLSWLFFAAPPSALLVAVTTHLTTDVASVPLLWLPPLALFLLTFVIAFSPLGDKLAAFGPTLKMITIFLLAIIMAANADQSFVGLLVHLVAFFLIVLGCHLYLADVRPEPARLTEFYLWMSLGGVLGGAAAALLAPITLNGTHEYEIALAAALAVAPWGKIKTRGLAVALALAIGFSLLFWNVPALALWLDAHLPMTGLTSSSNGPFWHTVLGINYPLSVAAIYCSCLMVIAVLAPRSAILTSLLGGLVLLVPLLKQEQDGHLFKERSFFGVLKLSESGTAPSGWRFLSHGTTLHGVMSLDPARSKEPMSYYYRKTPIGSLFEEATLAKPDSLQAGVIGLGMGSSLCYAKPGQKWTVFEIDADVVKVATDPKLVGFLNNCAPDAKIVLGDARINMRGQPDAYFDILLVDAFSSDAIPTHMITKEAIGEFMAKMKPDGLLIVHISNRYLNLGPIVADAAQSLGFAAMEGHRNGEASNPYVDTGVLAMVITRNAARLASYKGQAMWTIQAPVAKPRPWTDDHTDIMRALQPE
ncbi:MAG: hypothetical protein RLZZ157_1377 [Pseudomonadota bacterium]